MRLSEYVAQAQEILDRHKAERSTSTPHVWDKKSTPLSMTSHGVVTPSLSDLLAKPALIPTCNLPDKPRIVCPPIDCNRVSGKTALCKEIFELERILDSFAKSSDLLRKQYGNDLKKSLLALKNTNELPQPQWNQPAMNITKRDIGISRVIMNEAFEQIQNALSAGDIRFQWLRLGKTSCIVPMAIAILADKKQLSRLVVPKALLLQTAQTIQSRLGSLVGREVRYIPFSRRTTTSLDMLRLYSTHHHEMLQFSGVILTTPEHILSYKLSGLQRLADSRLDEAREMIRFQSWLTSTCRDILDESDFTLAVKTQLIYPSGPQISVDGHPNRWKVAQYLLSLVEDHFPCLQRDFPQSIEVTERTAGFPILHLLREDVEDALHYRIINDICNGRIPFLRLTGSSITVGKIWIRQVLSDHEIDDELIEKVSALFKDKSSARKNILLVRGLLLNRILLLCLKKRWNVQYGLHPNRDPIAVPFDAKGVPSEQAEFGHPDVSILFTCLAFYYTGLNLSQFQQSLQLVLKSDDQQQSMIGGLAALILYQNIKLQASGWDIPLFSKPLPEETIRCAKTTGFSGTNDNKMMLPLSIKQDDLPSLCQTNAEVLVHILQSRNRQYKLASRNGRRLKEEELLKRIKNSKIKILIDAGAYILEMDNKTLVKKWLKIDSGPQAAVYFGDDNRAWVQYRGGKDVVPLLATPFAENLEDCLVYIDEAHTRGVDLKLPQQAHGALTLGLGQTKDHMVQDAYLSAIQNPEHQSLEKLYGEVTDIQPSYVTDMASTKLAGFMKELNKRRVTTGNTKNYIHSSVLEEVEQEREVEFQIEQVRQVQKPTHYEALTFSGLHPDILHFVKTGNLILGCGYEHIFDALARTDIGQKYDVRRTKSKLYVSMEFMRTIELGNHRTNDNFLRPIEWILWNPSNETALIVIPEEVELLIPVIRTAKEPMLAHETTSYSLRNCAGDASIFTKNPIDFLLEWLTLRRKGQEIMHTPMGYICQARSLHEGLPFFASRSARNEELEKPSGDDTESDVNEPED
ncbi:hypothetical protein H4I96_12091 [Botrytis cinerea]